MASVPILLFCLCLCLSMGCLPLIDLLMTLANQNPNNSLVSVGLPAFFLIQLPLIYFSASTLLIFHVATSQSAQSPLLPVSRTDHTILNKLKSMAASVRPLLFFTLAVAICGLQLLDSLSPFSNQNSNKSFIYVAVDTSLFFLLPFTFFSAITLLLLHVAVSSF